jgi:hypothetical protein
MMLLMISSSAAFAQKDAKGCKDSPFLARYPGSTLTSCTDRHSDVFGFAMAGGTNKLVAGEYHQVTYDFSTVATKEEVAQRIRMALYSSGFSLWYESAGYYTARTGKTWIAADIRGGTLVVTTVIDSGFPVLTRGVELSGTGPQVDGNPRTSDR